MRGIQIRGLMPMGRECIYGPGYGAVAVCLVRRRSILVFCLYNPGSALPAEPSSRPSISLPAVLTRSSGIHPQPELHGPFWRHLGFLFCLVGAGILSCRFILLPFQGIHVDELETASGALPRFNVADACSSFLQSWASPWRLAAGLEIDWVISAGAVTILADSALLNERAHYGSMLRDGSGKVVWPCEVLLEGKLDCTGRSYGSSIILGKTVLSLGDTAPVFARCS
ncbi:hypothetical protein VTK56DRAFT_1502 [Thermocarpiscus australiensis]